jgi:hypothetical protein
MASTTQTCSLAQPAAVPLANHTMNILSGSYSGAISTSGSARILMAKIPATATRVQLTTRHTSGATSQVLNFGLKSGTAGSYTDSVSVFGQVADGVTFLSPAVDASTRWNADTGETFKYVIASLQSGSVTASFCLNYQITYTF